MAATRTVRRLPATLRTDSVAARACVQSLGVRQVEVKSDSVVQAQSRFQSVRQPQIRSRSSSDAAVFESARKAVCTFSSATLPRFASETLQPREHRLTARQATTSAAMMTRQPAFVTPGATVFTRGHGVAAAPALDYRGHQGPHVLPSRRPRHISPRAVAEVRPTTAPSTSSEKPTASVHADSPVVQLMRYLRAEKELVDKSLDSSLSPSSARSARIVEAMRYSLLAGGKRIRPILVLAAYDMFANGGQAATADDADGQGTDASRKRVEAAMPAALAVEMIHTMSLIHDDLPAMDNDDLRRGMPTCHKVYGEDTAILAGDALLAYAYEYVAANTRGVDPARVLRVVALLAESVGADGLAGGQVMDLHAEGRDDVTIEDLTWIHTHKTATLLRVSVAAGAILGGASEQDVERVSTFAVKTGLAFQIADDVLDVTASSETLGKTAGKDEAVNKATYPRLLGLEGSRAQAEKLIEEAKEALAPYGTRSHTLLALADFIINRAN